MIRRIRKGEGRLYKTVRLEALRESPEAFGSTYADALARSEESWTTQCDSAAEGSDRAIFVVDEPVHRGLAAIYRTAEGSTSGELLQMWVSPEARGSSTAGQLLTFALSWAEENGYAKVRATVRHGNEKALNFYKRHRFEETDLAAEEEHILEIELHTDWQPSPESTQ